MQDRTLLASAGPDQLDMLRCVVLTCHTMSRMIASTIALTTLLSLLAVCAWIATQSTSSAGDALDSLAKRQAADRSQAGYLLSSFSSTRDSALPGDTIGFIATISNRSDSTFTNLRVTTAVSDEESLIYLQDSTVGQFHEDAPASALPQLTSTPTTIAATLEPGQQVRIEWKMQVSECALRARWVNVTFGAFTDEGGALPPHNKYHYIHPHSNLLHAASKVDYRIDTPTPSPGGAVRHTVRIANTGFVTLPDVAIRLQRSDSAARVLPSTAANSQYVVVSPRDGYSGPLGLAGTVEQRGIIAGRSGLSGAPVHVDPAWSSQPEGFALRKLKPGSVLVFSWTDYVAADALIGVESESTVVVSIAGSTQSQHSVSLAVSPPRNDLQLDISPVDLGRLDASYLPGEVVTMRVAIVNHTTRDQSGLTVTLDLPFALSYIPDSGSYSALNSVDGNARRLPDDWIYTGARLPLLTSGQSATIVFKTRIDEEAAPQDNIEAHAVLRQTNGQEQRVTDRFHIVGAPDISLSVAPIETASAGDEVEYLVRVRNTGQVDLEGVEIGFELACGMSYVRDSVWFPFGGAFVFGRGGAFLLGESDSSVESPTDDDYLVQRVGSMAPGEETGLSLKMRVGVDVAAGQLAGPRFVTTARTVETAVLQAVMARQETGLTVVEPLVTAEEFDTFARRALADLTDVVNTTGGNTEQLAGVVEDIATTTTHIGEIAGNTEDLVGDTAEKVDSLLESELKGARPWGQGWSWAVIWGGFGVLASFLAGLLLALPAWAVLKWLWRRWGRAWQKRSERVWNSRGKLPHNARDWLNARWRR